MFLTRARTGELFVLTQAVCWSLFPICTILTYSLIPPVFSAAISTLVSTFFFAFMLTVKRGWRQLNRTAPWKDLLLAGFFIGICSYALMFTGLRYTTAGNASIIGLMEVFFAFLILGVLLKHERIQPMHIVGAVCMVAGALLILLPKSSGWHGGDAIILAATAVSPLGNRAMQRAKEHVTSECIMFVRSLIGGIFLLCLAFLLEKVPTGTQVVRAAALLCVTGIFLLGFSKILWVEGIHRIPITQAMSLTSIIPLFTLVFASVILQESITLIQIFSFFPIAVGLLILTRTPRNSYTNFSD